MLDNPYRTILQFVEMNLVRKNKTVIEALEELEQMFSDSPVENKVAEERIKELYERVQSNFGTDLQQDKDYTVQTAILFNLQSWTMLKHFNS